MKKTNIAVAIILVLTVLGAGAYFMAEQKPPDTQSANEIMPSPTVVMDQTNNAVTGNYLEFTPEVFQNSASGRRVLFFYANWCPTCRPADRNLSEQVSQIPADVTVMRVNYNDNQTDDGERELANEYKITYQHTFVQIDGSGNEVTKWNGGQIEELLANLK